MLKATGWCAIRKSRYGFPSLLKLVVIASVAKRVLAESVQMEEQLPVEQMQRMCRSVIGRTVSFLIEKHNMPRMSIQWPQPGRTPKAKSPLAFNRH
jgi:hypothetical protein